MDQLLEEILRREGSKDTVDSAGRTKYGISEKYHPEVWKDGPPTREEAKSIYFDQYIVGPNIHKIEPDELRNQVADFGVHSGPPVAIKHLQKILSVQVDGILGPITLHALSHRNEEDVNQKLVVSRVLLLSRIVQKRPSDLKYLFGWINRALSFLR